MGGERETEVPQVRTSKKGAISVDRVRIHESKGEVHFHDDARKMKVAVPTYVWHKAWEQLSSLQLRTWRFFDPTNSSVLLVAVSWNRENGKVVLDMELQPANPDKTFSSLNAFTFH